ncbi:MAG: heparinase II/III family protein [Sphaerochaeta sp.]
MLKAVVANKKSDKRILTQWTASNRQIWHNIPTSVKNKAIEEGVAAQKKSWPYLPLSLFREHTAVGNRERYQGPYFEKRRMLGSLVLAECIEGRGRFLADIEEGIWSIIGEVVWVIPAHNSYIRDTPALPTPQTGRPIIDLFAAETAALLALTIHLLEDRLDSGLLKTVTHQLQVRLVTPYLEDHFWWMGSEGEKLNNWTPWCTQNVLLCALTMGLSDDERDRVITQAAKSLDYWLDGYGEDGCCDEGPHYWHAAALCLYGSLFLLEEALGETVTALYEVKKIRNMASYICSVHIEDDLYLNFADSSPKAGRLGAREWRFGVAVNDEKLKRRALLDYRHDPFAKGDNDYNLLYRLFALLDANELMHADLPVASQKQPFIWYPSVELAIYRRSGFTLAVKGGNNDDSHNHNDVGSLILYDKAKPLLIDVGVETYTKTTFSDQRYTLALMQSHYHNVVNFPPYGQEAGAEYAAEILSLSDSFIDLELSKAYDGAAKVTSYRRSVTIEDGRVVVHERIDARHSPVLSLMSVDQPKDEDSALRFDGWSIVFDRSCTVTIEAMVIEDARLRQAWPAMLWRTTVAFENELVWSVLRTNQ